VDYRALNRITRKDRYPLPLITETLRGLSQATWFSKLDVSAAFHRIRIRKGDEWKTAFRTRFGLYEWLVTPFGLTGAPATFQRYINWALRDYLDDCCSAYIDDVLIYTSGTLNEHRERVRGVISRLRDAGLRLDIDKCEFEQKRVKYLGYIVDCEKGISVDPEKVAAIREWEPPSSVRGIRSFVGFANYYRDFIPMFTHLAKPLTNLTKKDVSFEWKEAQQEAFEVLKECLIHAPVLMLFDPDRPTRLEPDSSGYATGGALYQMDDQNRWRPVAFHSKRIEDRELAYDIHDKELLAVIRCLSEWDAELRSVPPFEIITDHKNLEYFLTKRKLNERQVRWAFELSRYNFQIVHRPGKQAVVPDALSRREQDKPEGSTEDQCCVLERQLFRSDGAVMRLTSLASAEDPSNEKFYGSVNISSGWIAKGDTDKEGDDLAPRDNIGNPFVDDDLREMWDAALEITIGTGLSATLFRMVLASCQRNLDSLSVSPNVHLIPTAVYAGEIEYGSLATSRYAPTSSSGTTTPT
jgi:RNase H-like domain found in reverse transcriptase/Reverse transcriptase (RNA-dependent DNA polymerase)